MLRLFGAVLVISACCFWGFSSVKQLYMHANSLRAVIASLNMMNGEIYSHLMPMRDILELLAESGPETTKKLYENVLSGMERLDNCPFCEIWRESVRKTPLHLTGEETEVLCELGAYLGKYDVEEQSRLISQTTRNMERFLKDAEDTRKRDSKVYAAFSLTAGIFTVIMLI